MLCKMLLSLDSEIFVRIRSLESEIYAPKVLKTLADKKKRALQVFFARFVASFNYPYKKFGPNYANISLAKLKSEALQK